MISNVPKDYIAQNGVGLGVWLVAQRKARRLGKLSEERIQLLDALGFEWVLETPFEKGMRYAKVYFDKHGDLAISKNYVSEDGYKLGQWRMNQLTALKKGSLKADKIAFCKRRKDCN